MVLRDVYNAIVDDRLWVEILMSPERITKFADHFFDIQLSYAEAESIKHGVNLDDYCGESFIERYQRKNLESWAGMEKLEEKLHSLE